MVKFLIKCGIDSISVNADAAKEISELVQQLESQSQIEPIDNKEEIKKEIVEIKQSEEKPNNLNPEPVEVIEDVKSEAKEEEPKKEDIFN
jgi:succinate dehydrogenase/fumarate reductase-like Fe-S protein